MFANGDNWYCFHASNYAAYTYTSPVAGTLGNGNLYNVTLATSTTTTTDVDGPMRGSYVYTEGSLLSSSSEGSDTSNNGLTMPLTQAMIDASRFGEDALRHLIMSGQLTPNKQLAQKLADRDYLRAIIRGDVKTS